MTASTTNQNLSTAEIVSPIVNRQSRCAQQLDLPPCLLVIFGASGDLTFRKLFPALFSLFVWDRLPANFAIMGISRTAYDDDSFQDKMRKSVEGSKGFTSELWAKLAKKLRYMPMSYDDPKDFKVLAKKLEELDLKYGTKENKLFYLAVPPNIYEPLAINLGKAGLAQRHEQGRTDRGWSRIVVEKPFGHDLPSARSLDSTLHQYFTEEQIFRIDHYLAKETVQNILMFRFANSIFEPIWNRNYIDYVSIVAAEDLGVGHRAGYYDQAGILRDMFQNHMMQLLALSAMEPPCRFFPNFVRDEKVRLYRCLRPFEVEQEFQDLVLGQYTSGNINGEQVPGYRQEPGIDSNSLTPTFAMIRVYLDNWRWQGVPFFLTSGKRLQNKLTRIVVQFKDVPHSMLRDIVGESIVANRLVMGIQPEEVIDMYFMAKESSPVLCLKPVIMRYDFNEDSDSFSGTKLDAYEKVLLDCILGDQMLFLRQDGVEQTWGFLTPILEMCEQCGDFERHLKYYPAGSWGPQAANELHPSYMCDVT